MNAHINHDVPHWGEAFSGANPRSSQVATTARAAPYEDALSHLVELGGRGILL